MLLIWPEVAPSPHGSATQDDPAVAPEVCLSQELPASEVWEAWTSWALQDDLLVPDAEPLSEDNQRVIVGWTAAHHEHASSAYDLQHDKFKLKLKLKI